MKARAFGLVVTLVAFTFFLPLVTPAAEKARFATHFRMNASYILPPAAAMDQGFWQQQGLEVEWVPFDSSGTMQKAVAAGAIGVGTASIGLLIEGTAFGLPEVIVADMGLTTYFYLWILEDSQLRRPQDLKGTTIGVSTFGQSTHYYSDMLVKNLGFERDTKLVALGGGRPAVAALVAGRVGSILFSDFTMLPLWAEGKVRLLLRMDEVVPGAVAYQILFATRGFTRSNPEVVKKVIAGFFKAGNFVLNNREWAIEKMKKEVRYSQKAAEKAFPLLHYSADGKINKDKLEKVIRATTDILVRYNAIPREKLLSVEQLYTCDFVGGC